MDDFERGYEFAIRQGGGSYAAEVGAEYVREVEAAIVELYRRMNAYDYYKATKPAQESLKGFIAEEFAAGTANVDAAVKGSGERFAVLQSHDLGSVDVASTGGRGLPAQGLRESLSDCPRAWYNSVRQVPWIERRVIGEFRGVGRLCGKGGS